MRVLELQLSNILSFEYKDDINHAFKITFGPSLNIIIGGNGSGKSTALEAINFVFSRVLFRNYDFNQQHFDDGRMALKKNTFSLNDLAGRLAPFRLQPNWLTESKSQAIKVTITLDDIDKSNIQNILDNYAALQSTVSQYSHETLPGFSTINGDESVELTITFSSADDSYTVDYNIGTAEHIKSYLENYAFLNEAILIYNATNNSHIDIFSNTFSMLSAFRNYTAFSLNTSLQSSPQEQFRSIRAGNTNRSNHQQAGEPSIFNMVKLQLGEHHYNLVVNGKNDVNSATKQVNELTIVKNINKKLEILKLEFSIRPINPQNWSYEFMFYDKKHGRDMGDINNLSAG